MPAHLCDAETLSTLVAEIEAAGSSIIHVAPLSDGRLVVITGRPTAAPVEHR